MIDHSKCYKMGQFCTDTSCVQISGTVMPVTERVPGVSPLTEKQAEDIARTISRHIHGEDHGETTSAIKAEILRVDKEAYSRAQEAVKFMAGLCDEALNSALLDVQQDCIAEAIKRRAAEAALDEAVRLLRRAVKDNDGPAGRNTAWWVQSSAFLTRHSTGEK